MALPVKDETTIANEEYAIYTEARDNGHLSYMRRAVKCENFFLGGGRQWETQRRLKIEAENRPVCEQNEILPTVQTIMGYQIDNRCDVQCLPARGPVDEEDASRMTKIIKHVFRENQYDWIESQVFQDGLIQQRGYFDIRIKFDDNLVGEVEISDEDPLDIIPDQFSNSYDPQKWKQVIKTRWLTYDEVVDLYGEKKADDARNLVVNQELGAEDGVLRNNFQNSGIVETTETVDKDGNVSITTYQFTGYETITDPDRVQATNRRIRVIERQFKIRTKRQFLVDVVTGDMRPVPDDFKKEQIKNVIAKMGGKVVLYSKTVERIRWRVTAGNILLHDEWSPYEFFTIVPYFAYFRRGKTIGVVDNLISPQQMLNEMITHSLHIANTTANSGWVVEEDSLVDMEKEDLEEEGSKAGFVIMYARGSEPPQKIKPNPVPGAIERIIERAHLGIQTISSIDPSAKGMKDGNESGISQATRQAQHSLQISGPLDNLARTRYMVARRVIDLIQQFYTEERQLKIVGTDDDGKEVVEPLDVNQVQDDGSIMHDLTLGEFGVVIHTVPAHSTFEATQMNQLVEFKRVGMNIPDDEIIKRSNLSDRFKLAERMRKMAEKTPEQQQLEQQIQQGQLRQVDADVRATLANAQKLLADAARAMNTVMTGSIENAATLNVAPQLAGLADAVRTITTTSV